MGPHDFIDPHRPFADELNLCHVLLDDQDPHVTIRGFSPNLRELFLGYCESNVGGTFTNTRARLRGFVEHAMRLGAVSPTRAELNLAPELCRWCFVDVMEFRSCLGTSLATPPCAGARAQKPPRCFRLRRTSGGRGPRGGTICSTNMSGRHCLRCRLMESWGRCQPDRLVVKGRVHEPLHSRSPLRARPMSNAMMIWDPNRWRPSCVMTPPLAPSS